MAWKLNAMETRLRRQHRVDGVGRPKFDFHTGVAAPRGAQAPDAGSRLDVWFVGGTVDHWYMFIAEVEPEREPDVDPDA